ncbi:MAG TPA: biotin carboxylase N-terminal domain-containing protein, partial [Dongiaceae bacterium]|nr:biotin carboxylase N-terminal domain-containing protein [Dongiaceae bacterium]
MFRSVLIANRGEIACRIAATLREMGIRSIAVCSEADRGALHTRRADDVRVIGPPEPRQSYLNIPAILAAARETGAEAIHPGYGFLAENAEFAAAVEAAGLVFIGPTAEQIRTMGDKRAARALAVEAKVPVVPGGEGRDADALAREAKRIGYPVMVKAALGGGGKGMRVVTGDAELREAVESATRLAASAFGDAAVYLEKAIAHPRHVEVQVLGDGAGDAVHMFERECSLQRRHQKVIEECPSPAVDETLRERVTFAAVSLAKAVRYRGAGTIEFLLAPEGHYYFLERNTRLQVEHPVTELVTGLDLVRLQIEVAATGRLPLAQPQVMRRGHAIEARVYA